MLLTIAYYFQGYYQHCNASHSRGATCLHHKSVEAIKNYKTNLIAPKHACKGTSLYQCQPQPDRCDGVIYTQQSTS
jgi:hypothetical protein